MYPSNSPKLATAFLSSTLQNLKVTIDVKYTGKAPGVVSKVLIKPSDAVKVGQQVAVVDVGAMPAAAAAPPPKPVAAEPPKPAAAPPPPPKVRR